MDTQQVLRMPFVNVFGVHIHRLTRKQTLALCQQWLHGTTPRHIVTANAEILLRARTHRWFHDLLQKADLVTADGAGARWAAAFLYSPMRYPETPFGILRWFARTLAVFFLKPQSIPDLLPERITGADLVVDITRVAAEEGMSVYLVGGKRQTASRAAKRLLAIVPTATIHAFASDHSATPYPPYDLHIALADAAPSVLFVGYGSPLQETWIRQNLHRFPSLRIAIGVGGALDFLAGNALRAPEYYQQHSLEWLWRLTHDPRRALRILRATLVFSMILLASRLYRVLRARAFHASSV